MVKQVKGGLILGVYGGYIYLWIVWYKIQPRFLIHGYYKHQDMLLAVGTCHHAAIFQALK